MEEESSHGENMMTALRSKLHKETVVPLNNLTVNHLDEQSGRWSVANTTQNKETDNQSQQEEQRKRAIQQLITKQSHVPLNEAGQIDWNQIDHVYYYHTRKAG